MMSFQEFLVEMEAEYRVHHNVSVAHLKAFTKNVGEVRYVIDKHHKLHMGAAHSFIHRDIDPNSVNDTNEGREGSINGFAEHKDGKFTHHPEYKKTNQHSDGNVFKNIRHPIISKMHKAGFKRTKEPPEFAW